MADSVALAKNGILDLSIDELFEKYSLAQIQSLHRDYKSSVSRAKHDLHALVGEKYRDLIRIAEDINNMSTMSKTIDSQITELSYMSSRHVLFGNNRFSKFESMVRAKNAKAARANSQKTILNSVINNKLIGYDLKLQTDTLSSAASLVYMAKVYYTVSTRFRSTLQANPYISANFLHLKQNFVLFLEQKIASYAARDVSGNSLAQLLFVDSKSQWIEPANVDLLTEELDDVVDDDADSDESGLSSKNNYYSGPTAPMISYLLAYTIVHHDDAELNSLNSIAEKYIQLRFSYLERIIEEQLASGMHEPNNINFTVILKFIETTCSYAHNCFFSSASNELHTQLKHLSNWNISDLIGFHHWFEEETVLFDKLSYKILTGSSLENTLSMLTQFLSLLYKTLKQILNSPSNATEFETGNQKLFVFHNFVAALRKVEIISNSNESECYVTKLVSGSDVVAKLLTFISGSLRDIFNMHQAVLTLQIATQIAHELESNKFTTGDSYELFSVDFVQMIDSSVDNYFETVLDISAQDEPVRATKKSIDAPSLLKFWFQVENQLLDIIQMSSDNAIGKVASAIERGTETDVSVAWGSFNSSSFSDVFDKLRQQVISTLAEKLRIFIKQMSTFVDQQSTFKNRDQLHYLSRLFLILKRNLLVAELTKLEQDLEAFVNKSVKKIHEMTFSNLLESGAEAEQISFKQFLSSDRVATNDSETVPIRPDLVLSSILSQLASQLTTSDTFKRHEIYSTYSDAKVKDLFIEIKNEWILRELTEAAVSQPTSQPTTKVNGATEHESVDDKKEIEQEKTSFGDEGSNGVEQNDVVAEEDSTQKLNDSDTADVVDEKEDAWNDEFENDGWDEEIKEDLPVDVERTNAEANEVPTERAVNDLESTPQATSHSLLITAARQTLVNVAFVLNFTEKSGIQRLKLSKHIETLNSLCETELEDSTIDIIVRAANDFYKASKNVYLPLLLN